MKPTEIIAVIDVGSNTIRILIGKLKKDKIIKIYHDRAVTQLGKNINTTKRLNNNSIEKSIKIIKKFKAIAEEFNSTEIIAIGTSALRESLDGQDFCNKVREESGLSLKIITGNQEAYYMLEGIVAGLKVQKKELFAIDIGGGSTEWIYLDGQEILKGSIPSGALRDYKIFFKSDPPLQFEIENFYQDLRKKIEKNIPLLRINKIYVTGGTATTIAMIEKKLDFYNSEDVHLTKISIKNLKSIFSKISKLPVNSRKNIAGLTQDRAGIIIPGIIIMDSICEYVKAKEIIVSDYGLMEGIMKNYKDFCYN
ncbi:MULTISPECIES: Ppx/GppA phosphatase family protein [Thermodesulfovibrio]|jgi:exopolyphosphatase/guanosine-5'-triphosphate,3'-diphosphate pyrophosphatase|uniref:Ppx/GppA phosphatase family protein n=1 Tax=Thermodesulfovibrio TaxID=28261 RepID=UPI002626C0CC|nr:hypothetical protein [Thermodesulfovibrio sp.]